MIKKASDCSIAVFMDVLFNGNFLVLVQAEDTEPSQIELNEAWQTIYMEYVDMSGLSQTTELHLLSTIKGLECRLKLVPVMVDLHRKCLEQIGQPFYPAFKELKRYGHSLWWDKDGNNDAFINKLDAVLIKEKRYVMELESKYSELMKYKKNIADNAPIEPIKRADFIRIMNQLGKYSGFKIDKNNTTVEEFAIMQCDYNAACEAAANAK